MAVTNRLRSVPPSMCTDEVLLELDPEIRLTGLLLRFYTDDHGRGSANPALVRSQLYPLTSTITDEVIEWHLVVLEDVGYIRTYKVDTRLLLQVVEWPSQDRAQPSRLQAPPADEEPGVTAVTPSSRESREDVASRSRAPREDVAVVEEREERGERASGEGERGEGGAGGESAVESARALLQGKPEPSPFCKRHPTGTDAKCMPCGRARLAHGQWVKAQMEAADEDLGEAP